jgi:hypothetical protein
MISGVETHVAASALARHAVLSKPPHSLLAENQFKLWLSSDRNLSAKTVAAVVSCCRRLEKQLSIGLADHLEIGVAHDALASSQALQLASRLGTTPRARDSVAYAARLFARFLWETGAS